MPPTRILPCAPRPAHFPQPLKFCFCPCVEGKHSAALLPPRRSLHSQVRVALRRVGRRQRAARPGALPPVCPRACDVSVPSEQGDDRGGGQHAGGGRLRAAAEPPRGVHRSGARRTPRLACRRRRHCSCTGFSALKIAAVLTYLCVCAPVSQPPDEGGDREPEEGARGREEREAKQGGVRGAAELTVSPPAAQITPLSTVRMRTERCAAPCRRDALPSEPA